MNIDERIKQLEDGLRDAPEQIEDVDSLLGPAPGSLVIACTLMAFAWGPRSGTASEATKRAGADLAV